MVQKTADFHLVRAAQLGDVYAFEALVGRHRGRAYRVALRMLGDPMDAEDAAQDAFVQAWRALPAFRAESTFSTWLLQIVTRRCLNALRSRRSLEPLEHEPPDERSRVPELAESHAELAELKRALLRLSPEQRGPLVLRELEGLSYEEVADVLELTVPAVKGRIHRARLELVTAMREWR